MSGTPPDSSQQPGLPAIPGITLHHEIARGGMGVVYAGRQDFLDRRVAVKFLSVELGGPSFAQRFQREAKILAGIKHPNIVACHMAGTTDDGQSYLVMEFIDGPSLKAWIAEHGPMPPLAALRLARATAQALGHAHLLDVIHRDVKPENILLESVTSTAIDVEFPFTPKLVDLGLARVTHEQAGMGLTSPGSVMGTPATMSPEQFDEPDKVDFRSDIYGLGCSLYEMLVGRPAFRGRRLTEIVAKKRHPIGPNPCDENPAVPAAVGAFVQRLLAADRELRPGSYRELDEAIGDLMQVLAAAGTHTETLTDMSVDDLGATVPSGPRNAGQPRPSAPPAPRPSAPPAPRPTAPPPQPTAGPAPAPPDATKGQPGGPGLLRTAEIDFLSAQPAAGTATGAPAPTAFRDSGVAAGTAVAPPPASGWGRFVAVAVVAAMLAGVAGWMIFGRGQSGGGSGGGGGADVPNAAPIVVNRIVGPDQIDLGEQFTLGVDVQGAAQRHLEYRWQWPRGISQQRAGQREATFRIDDGLPGVRFTVSVSISDRSDPDHPVVAEHEIVVGKCPERQPLLGIKQAGSRWTLDSNDRLVWTFVTLPDGTDSYLSCKTRGRSRTCTTDIGDELFWEWTGSLEPKDDPAGFAAMGVRFEFGAHDWAVWSTRSEDEGQLWTIELMEAVRSPTGWQYRPLPKRYAKEFRLPADAAFESRAWFSVQRRGGEMTFQVGEERVTPSGDEGRSTTTLDRLDPLRVELGDGDRPGKLTLFVDNEGIGRFRITQR